MLYFRRAPWLIKKLFPGILWVKNEKLKTVYLTFDDGPNPKLTPWILKELKKFDAKATFFCLGKNVRNHTQIFKSIIDEGHGIGNHGFNHISGWETGIEKYLEDVGKAACIIPSNLFRPAFGRMTLNQYRRLRKKYKIVMWDLMPGDFDRRKHPDKMYRFVIQYLKPGSIIVLHDNKESENNIKQLLPRLLEYFSKNNFQIIPLRSCSSV